MKRDNLIIIKKINGNSRQHQVKNSNSILINNKRKSTDKLPKSKLPYVPSFFFKSPHPQTIHNPQTSRYTTLSCPDASMYSRSQTESSVPAELSADLASPREGSARPLVDTKHNSLVHFWWRENNLAVIMADDNEKKTSTEINLIIKGPFKYIVTPFSAVSDPQLCYAYRF